MTTPGLVLFGDVVDSRLDGPAAADWLRGLCAELDDSYAGATLAPFGFTQGDEIQGVVDTDADPLLAVLRASLRSMPDDGSAPPTMRWVIAFGAVEPGRGPATQRTGPAFLAARELIERARRRRETLLVSSGHATVDEELDDVAPVLGTLLRDLTSRQRHVGRLLIVDGLRQSEAADALRIARPTVSVAAERAHVRDIERLHRATLRLLRRGIAAEEPA